MENKQFNALYQTLTEVQRQAVAKGTYSAIFADELKKANVEPKKFTEYTLAELNKVAVAEAMKQAQAKVNAEAKANAQAKTEEAKAPTPEPIAPVQPEATTAPKLVAMPQPDPELMREAEIHRRIKLNESENTIIARMNTRAMKLKELQAFTTNCDGVAEIATLQNSKGESFKITKSEAIRKLVAILESELTALIAEDKAEIMKLR
jgi:hypothetical protein